MQQWDKSLVVYREILNERQGDDRLWFSYGYAALQGGQYDKAVNGFDQALHISEMVESDPVNVPNRYRVFAGEAAIKTYQDKRALDFFREALKYADSISAKDIQSAIDWIQWDDGGIATAEYRDRAFKAEKEERWNDAREAYLAGLGQARTQKAYWELTYRLALVEFKYGSRADALARMKEMLEKNQTLAPDYNEGYGKMLYANAQELEKSGEKREALSYYLQATKIPWTGQGVGFLDIARIAANDLNTAIEQATKALTFPLTDDQKQAAYAILESSYRAKGDWDKMKQYRALMEAQR
jgi:tetratricopeptide (TPR) repeat protein